MLGGAAVATALAEEASAADPSKIGLSGAFSGPNAAAGQTMQPGADLAMAEINAAGGVLGRRLAPVLHVSSRYQ
jgi:branched-chain amino acid transport system substrate-binding protein